MKQFSIKEAISFGWERFKKHSWLLIAVTLTTTVLPQVLQSSLQSTLNIPTQLTSLDQISPAIFVIIVITMIIGIYLSIGVARVYLQINDGKKTRYTDLFNVTAREFIQVFIAGILYSLALLVAVLLILIPLSFIDMQFVSQLLIAMIIAAVIYVVIKLQFYIYLIVDKKRSAVDSLKESFAITKGQEWQLVFLMFTYLGILLLGLVALIVGLLIAIPVTGLATTYVYRKLAGTSSSKA